MYFDAILTRSATMQAILCSARLVASTKVNVLITGESATGKEWVAKAIHQSSPRKQHPFITVNCAALPETLAESLLFGHRKGSFTGADQAQTGLIAAADLDALERDLLQQALEKSQQNKTQAARLLGISRDALNYRLKKYLLA